MLVALVEAVVEVGWGKGNRLVRFYEAHEVDGKLRLSSDGCYIGQFDSLEQVLHWLEHGMRANSIVCVRMEEA